MPDDIGAEHSQFLSRGLCANPPSIAGNWSDEGQLVSDALARDGVEIHLNSTIMRIRVEGGRRVVTLVNDGHTATGVR